MSAYLIKRLLWAVPTFLGAVTIIFLIMRILPGDVAMLIMSEEGQVVDPVQLEAMRTELGLNQPLYVQYFSWLWGVVRLDLGVSLWTGQTVWHEITARLPYTLMLIAMSLVVSIVLAIPMGVVSALKQDTWVDYGLRTIAIAGIAMPSFWVGILVLLVMITAFRWYPPLDYSPIYRDPVVAMQQLILPALALGYPSAAIGTRMMRSSMLEVLREDYVRTARSKGLRERTVLYFHALKNAILPVITILGLQTIMVFSSAVIIEQIFNVPGLGRLVYNAIIHRDVILVQGVVACLTGFVILVNLTTDLIYAWVDPRVRFR